MKVTRKLDRTLGVTILSLVILFVVCAGGTVEGADPIDFSKSMARTNPYVAGAGVAAAAVCSAPTGDIISERFGDGGSTACYSGATGDDVKCDNTWTVPAVTPTFVPDWYYTLSGTPPEGASCAYGLNLPLTSDGNRARVYIAAAVNTDVTADIKFSFYLESLGTTLTDGLSLAFLSLHEDNEGGDNTVKIKNLSGNPQLYCTGANNSVATTIAADTWYEVTMHLDATAASSYCQVTGGGVTTCDAASECAFTRSVAGGAATNLVIGKVGYTTYDVNFTLGYITINTP